MRNPFMPEYVMQRAAALGISIDRMPQEVEAELSTLTDRQFNSATGRIKQLDSRLRTARACNEKSEEPNLIRAENTSIKPVDPDDGLTKDECKQLIQLDNMISDMGVQALLKRYLAQNYSRLDVSSFFDDLIDDIVRNSCGGTGRDDDDDDSIDPAKAYKSAISLYELWELTTKVLRKPPPGYLPSMETMDKLLARYYKWQAADDDTPQDSQDTPPTNQEETP